MAEPKYVPPTRLDHPDVRLLLEARKGKRDTRARLHDLRHHLQYATVGGRSVLRMNIVRAERTAAAYREQELRALASLELYANSLGKTTVRSRAKHPPTSRASE